MTCYPLDIWSPKDSTNWFYVTEIDPCNLKVRKSRIIVITHNHFLLLSQIPHKGFGVLVFWTELAAISNLRYCTKDEFMILFEWKLEQDPTFQLFKTSQNRIICQLLIKNLTELGSIAQNSFIVDIEENEEKFKVFEVLRKIERSERLLEALVDDEKILSLIALYQKAIEYLSVLNDDRAELYIKKLQSLFNDVRVLKQIFSEMKVKDSKRNRGKSFEKKIESKGLEEKEKEKEKEKNKEVKGIEGKKEDEGKENENKDLKIVDLEKEEKKDIGTVVETHGITLVDKEDLGFGKETEGKEEIVESSEENLGNGKVEVEIGIKDVVIEKDDHLNLIKDCEVKDNEVVVEKEIEDEEIKSL